MDISANKKRRSFVWLRRFLLDYRAVICCSANYPQIKFGQFFRIILSQFFDTVLNAVADFDVRPVGEYLAELHDEV